MIPIFLYQTVMAINVNWSQIVDPIGKLFSGGETYVGLDGLNHTTTGILGSVGGDPMLMGAFVFFVLFVLTLVFGLGMLVGSVVIIPSLFAVFQWIPNLQIVVAIICGLVFGLGLHRLVRR
jgi:hypothetical protein